MSYQRVRELIKTHEGLSLELYKCSAGKYTIGYGRNLEARGITEDEAELMLTNDLNEVVRQVQESFPWFHDLDGVRKAVVVDMVFNLGLAGFLKFKDTIKYASSGDYLSAGSAMMDSLWAEQVGRRADTLSEMMKTGAWPVSLDN